MSNTKADNDKIVSFSQLMSSEGLDAPNMFGIPEPPEGFDPESNPVFTNEEAIPNSPLKEKLKAKKRKVVYVAKVRTFIVGREGNADLEEILSKGMQGELILSKKEVSDIRESSNYKVYLEWMEPSTS